MRGVKPIVAGVLTAGLALFAVLAFESFYDVRVGPRRAGVQAEPTPAEREGAPLPLRLVDSGGVGVPVEGEWGADYSHDLKIFPKRHPQRTAIRGRRGFAGLVNRQWRDYVERMLGYGNNAVTIPLLLELIDFTRVKGATAARGGTSVYDGESAFRARHAAVRRHFAPLLGLDGRARACRCF